VADAPACRQGGLVQREKNGITRSLDDRFNRRLPMGIKSQYAQWFSGRTEWSDLSLRSMAAMREEHRLRELEREFHTKPFRMIARASAGWSSSEGFAWACIEASWRRHQASLRECSGTNQYLLGSTAAGSPFGVFHFDRVAKGLLRVFARRNTIKASCDPMRS